MWEGPSAPRLQAALHEITTYPSGALFYPGQATLRVVRRHFLFALANANLERYRTTVAARICAPSCADAAVADAPRRALRCRNTAGRDRSSVKHCVCGLVLFPTHAQSLAAPQGVRPLIFRNLFQSPRCRIF